MPTLTSRLDAAVQRHAMLSHPFYQAWTEGRLDRAILGRYAMQYYAQVKAFPTYVSGVHSQCSDLDIRRLLLDNLIEEEHGPDHHPELWLRFAEGLGLDRAAVDQAELLPETELSVSQLRTLTRDAGVIAGLAALYAYESQIPEVSSTKRAGLKEFYGLDDERSTAFFRVHEEADVFHSASERELLEKLCETSEQEAEALASAEDAARSLWTFLDGVARAYLPEECRTQD